MFELKITATTPEELLRLAAALGAMGSAVSISAEVPLPEIRLPIPEPEVAAPKPSRAKRVLPVKEEEHAALEERPTETASAPIAEAEQNTSASVEPASEASQDPKDSSPQDTSTPTNAGVDAMPADVVNLGYPEEGEIYMLVGDDWIFDPRRTEERRTTYKDGGVFSDAGRDKGYLIYEDHAPEVDTAEDTHEDLPEALKVLIAATETVDTWADAKQALAAFQKTELWPTLTSEQGNHIRASAWETLVDREVKWLPDPANDISAFRLWVEAEDDPNKILLMLGKLKADATRPEGPMKTVSEAADARIKALT